MCTRCCGCRGRRSGERDIEEVGYGEYGDFGTQRCVRLRRERGEIAAECGLRLTHLARRVHAASGRSESTFGSGCRRTDLRLEVWLVELPVARMNIRPAATPYPDSSSLVRLTGVTGCTVEVAAVTWSGLFLGDDVGNGDIELFARRQRRWGHGMMGHGVDNGPLLFQLHVCEMPRPARLGGSEL
jgi:hypothetical protein